MEADAKLLQAVRLFLREVYDVESEETAKQVMSGIILFVTLELQMMKKFRKDLDKMN